MPDALRRRPEAVVLVSGVPAATISKPGRFAIFTRPAHRFAALRVKCHVDTVENPHDIRHVLVMYDGSAAARRALAEAAALTAGHDAALTVVTLVVHERQAVGCCVPAATWNRELDIIVEEQLAEAQAILGSYRRSAHLAAVEGDGPRAVHRTAEALGCDLVLVPAHGLLPKRLARGCRRAGCSRVIAVRAG